MRGDIAAPEFDDPVVDLRADGSDAAAESIGGLEYGDAAMSGEDQCDREARESAADDSGTMSRGMDH
jgi:hypothetical protein